MDTTTLFDAGYDAGYRDRADQLVPLAAEGTDPFDRGYRLGWVDADNDAEHRTAVREVFAHRRARQLAHVVTLGVGA